MKIMFLQCAVVWQCRNRGDFVLCYLLLLESIQLYKQNVHVQIFAT